MVLPTVSELMPLHRELQVDCTYLPFHAARARLDWRSIQYMPQLKKAGLASSEEGICEVHSWWAFWEGQERYRPLEERASDKKYKEAVKATQDASQDAIETHELKQSTWCGPGRVYNCKTNMSATSTSDVRWAMRESQNKLTCEDECEQSNASFVDVD